MKHTICTVVAAAIVTACCSGETPEPRIASPLDANGTAYDMRPANPPTGTYYNDSGVAGPDDQSVDGGPIVSAGLPEPYQTLEELHEALVRQIDAQADFESTDRQGL